VINVTWKFTSRIKEFPVESVSKRI